MAAALLSWSDACLVDFVSVLLILAAWTCTISNSNGSWIRGVHDAPLQLYVVVYVLQGIRPNPRDSRTISNPSRSPINAIYRVDIYTSLWRELITPFLMPRTFTFPRAVRVEWSLSHLISITLWIVPQVPLSQISTMEYSCSRAFTPTIPYHKCRKL